jgi:hypothetical protein
LASQHQQEAQQLVEPQLQRRLEQDVSSNEISGVEEQTHLDGNGQCQNCKRMHVPFREEPLSTCQELVNYLNMSLNRVPLHAISFKRKFCLFEKADVEDEDEITLCKECQKALIKDELPGNASNEHLASKWCWPAFVWSILRDKKARARHGDALWALIPFEWRLWWIGSVKAEWPNSENVTANHPAPYVTDVSRQVGMSATELKKLEWETLVVTVDKYLAIPHVRCPWGCSEFYNHAKTIALDVVFASFLEDRDKDLLMSSQTQMDRMVGARPDFISSRHNILENPNWWCSPCIAYENGKGPVVLTCRNHGNGSKLRYIHVPTNPTGTVMSDATDQLATVVARPRTINTMKAHEYSITYHMGYVFGTFEGIDSLTLSDHGRYDINSRLSDKRDALAMTASPYLVHHIEQMMEEEQLPEWYGRDKIEFAANEYPADVVDELRKEHCRGATFVTLQDAIAMEIELRQSSRRVVTRQQGNQAIRIHFEPSWPSMILVIHPVDSWGAKMPVVPKMADTQNDNRGVWLVTAMMSSVPPLWKIISDAVADANAWYGWMLTYVAQKCFPNAKATKVASKNNPFRIVKTVAQLRQLFFDPLNDGFFEPSIIGTLFAALQNVHVVSSEDWNPEEWANVEQEVIVVYRSWNVNHVIMLPHSMQTAANKLWELRFIGSTNVIEDYKWNGTIYSRHGTLNFPMWWVHHRDERQQKHYSHSSAHLCQRTMDSWDVAVYVNARMPSMENLKEKYLLSCGGQVRIRCSRHKLPLVTAPLRTNVACHACHREIRYVCPYHECTVGICRFHYQERMNVEHDTAPFYINIHDDTAGGLNNMGANHEVHQDDSNDDSSFYPESSTSSSDSLTAAGNWLSEFYDYNSDDSSTDSNDSSSNAANGVDYNQYGTDDADTVDGALLDMVHGDVDDYLLQLEQENTEVLDPEDCVTCNVFETDHLEADDNNEFDKGFPTTNAGRFPVHAETDHHTIGMHVIFNKHGHVLVRKNRKLLQNRAQQHFIQGLVATRANTTIPLVFPDAMIFPSIFWNSCLDGSMIGSIPSALLLDDRTMRCLGVASLHDHYQSRIMDTSLLTSTDYRYLYHALDGILNLQNRGQDTRIVFSRRMGALENERGGARCIGGEPEQHVFDSDSVDSRPVVNKLAAAMGEEMPTLFYTHTCSMKTHFGMRVIRNWLDSEEAIKQIWSKIDDRGQPISSEEEHQLRHDLMQSSCVLALRCWINVVEIYMQYITKSNERPIGTVTKSWYRLELQDAAANLPHIHSIIWLKENDGTEHGRAQVLSHIRASMRCMVTPQEEQHYIDKGVVSSREELSNMLETAHKMLLHKHTRRCLIPAPNSSHHKYTVNEVAAKGDMTTTDLLQQGARCKVPNNFLMSPNPNDHSFVEISIAHSSAALEVMQIIGLVGDYTGDGDLVQFLDPRLVVKRHIPPTSACEGIVSPALVPLLLYVLSSMNVQLMDMYTASRYCAKYAGGTDESNRIYLRPPRALQDHHTLNVDIADVGNTKITSVKFLEDEKSKLERRKPDGRALGASEAAMLVLGIPQVYTDIKFIHIPSVPLEERPAFDRPVPIGRLIAEGIVQVPVPNISDIDAQTVIPSHAARHPPYHFDFPIWRQFTEEAVMLAKDELVSPYSINATAVFGLRPPELLFVNRQKEYFRWFERFDVVLSKEEQTNRMDSLMNYCDEHLHIDYSLCCWIDGTTKIVKLRAAALPEILRWIEAASLDDFGDECRRPHKNSVRLLFQDLQRHLQNEKAGNHPRSHDVQRKWAYQKEHFLCAFEEQNLPTTWYTPIKPVQSNRFLIHVLLSMGRFRNELELSLSGSLRNAFIRAKLYNHDEAQREESVNTLTRDYVMTQLLHQPGGTPQFDRFVVAAYTALRNALINDTMAADGMPPCLYTHLLRDTNEKIETFLKDVFDRVRLVLLSELQDMNLPNLPSMEELQTARSNAPQNVWDPLVDVPRGVEQSLESYAEQRVALEIGKSLISQYRNPKSDSCPKCLAVVGDPGSGKTTVVKMLAMHAMSCGLNVMMTTLIAERAIQLGGTHIHLLLSLPVKQNIRTPGHMADLAIRKLYQQPQKLQLLQRMDVLVIDEIGQLSAEALGVFDIVLRRVRNSTSFMGGVLLICSMDILQLLPIWGRPPMLSPHMLTSFKFARLVHSVRAASDKNWQRIQKITRIMPTDLTPEIITEFQDLIRTNCTFVTSVDDPKIQKSALLVFGKKDARNQAQKDMVARMKASGGHTVSIAVDEEATKEGNWTAASDLTRQKLDRVCKEPAELYFFQGGLYEMTYNKPGCFSQSQLAILMDVPCQEHVNAFRSIEIYVSPPGSKTVPQDGVTKEELLEMRWTIQRVGPTPERPEMVARNLSARREQYGLRHRFASTIHAAMGQELSQLVTKVDMNTDLYDIWERAQVVVLLSRTKRAADTIFVGDTPETTIDTLTATLLRTTQYTKYTCYLLDALTREQHDGGNPVRVVDQQNHPYRPIDIELPMDNTGCCYILVSCQDTSVTYIGETSNLPARIDAHNSGHGSHQTQSEYLRPWGVLAYVVGFEGNVAKRKAFESQWKNVRITTTAARGRLSAVDVAELAKQVISMRKIDDPDEDLRYVRTGTVAALSSMMHSETTQEGVQAAAHNTANNLPTPGTTTNPPTILLPRRQVRHRTAAARRSNAQSVTSHHYDEHYSHVDRIISQLSPARIQHGNNSIDLAGAESNIEDVPPTPNSASQSTTNLSRERPLPLTSILHPQHPLYLTPEELETAEELTLARERNAPLTVSEIEAAMTTTNFGTRLRYRLRNKLLLQPLTGNNISYAHYHTLSPGLDLSDPIVVHFLRKKTRAFVENSTIHLFDTAQYTMWQDHDRDRSNGSLFLPPGSVLDNFLTRRQRTGGPDILNCHGWLFPIADAEHWQLIVVTKPKSRERKIAVIDSLVAGRHRPLNIASLEQFITQFVNTAVRLHTPAGSDPDYVSQDQWIRYVSIAGQPNGFDCGVFTICNAFHACHHLDDIANATGEHLDIMHWFTSSEGVNQRAILRNELRDDILRAAPLTAQNQRA